MKKELKKRILEAIFILTVFVNVLLNFTPYQDNIIKAGIIIILVTAFFVLYINRKNKYQLKMSFIYIFVELIILADNFYIIYKKFN